MENLSQPSIQKDSDSLKETDAMGREKFWEDLGRPDDRE